MPTQNIVAINDPQYVQLKSNERVGGRLSLVVLFGEYPMRESELSAKCGGYEILAYSVQITGMKETTRALLVRSLHEPIRKNAAIVDVNEKCRGYVLPEGFDRIIWLPRNRDALLWGIRTLGLVTEALRLV